MHQHRLDEHLTELSMTASQLLRGAGCAVTVLQDDVSAIVASSHDWAQAVETPQMRSSIGPSVYAARASCTVAVDDWSRQGRQWPDCRRAALQVGVRSSMSFPLKIGGAAAAAISVHDCEPNISRSSRLSAAHVLAAFATSALTVALRQDRLQREAAELEHSLVTSRPINQAVGIIMARTRCTPEEALARLDGVARRTHATPLAVAARIIYRTTGRRPDSDIHVLAREQQSTQAA